MNETNEFFQKFYFDTFPGIEQIISFTAFVHSIDDGMIDEFNIVRRNEEFIGLFNYPHFKGHSMTTEIKQEVMSICYSEYGDGGSFLRRYNDDLIYGLLLNSEGKPTLIPPRLRLLQAQPATLKVHPFRCLKFLQCSRPKQPQQPSYVAPA